MLELFTPDVLVAFPGGSGTYDMICQSDSAGVEIVDLAM